MAIFHFEEFRNLLLRKFKNNRLRFDNVKIGEDQQK